MGEHTGAKQQFVLTLSSLPLGLSSDCAQKEDYRQSFSSQEQLNLRPDLSAKIIALYAQDTRRFAIWLQQEHPGLKATEVTPTDAKTYRGHLLAKRYAPTTINQALISLMLFFDTIEGTNPFRNLTIIDIVEPAPVALSKTEWNAMRYSHLSIFE